MDPSTARVLCAVCTEPRISGCLPHTRPRIAPFVTVLPIWITHPPNICSDTHARVASFTDHADRGHNKLFLTGQVVTQDRLRGIRIVVLQGA